jgi:putative DNA primase/helicase
VVNKPLGSYDGSNTHAEAGLLGKQLLVDDDFSKGSILPDGFIKKISEEKTLTANPKSKDEYSFVSRAVPAVCSNHWPITRDVSSAFVNRGKVFNLNYSIPTHLKDDQKKAQMLQYELPGILNKFIKGFARLRKRGTWDDPIDCIVAHTHWQKYSNPSQMFISERVSEVSKGFIKSTDIWDDYRYWHKENNPSGGMLKKVEFLDRMDSLMGARTTLHGYKGFKGFELLEEE